MTRRRPEALPKTAPTHRCRVALLSLGGLVVLVAAGLVGWTQTEHFQRVSAALVEQALEDQTGEQVTLTGVELGLFPPRASVEGLHIWNEETDSTILTVERLTATVVLDGTSVRLDHVQIDRPSISLEIDEGGKLTAFRDLKQGGGGGLTRLPWNSLGITDGDLSLSYPQGQVSVRELEVRPISGSLADITGSIRVQHGEFADGAELDLRGVTLGPEVIAIPRLVVQGRSVELRGSVVVPLRGDIDVRTTVMVDLDELTPLLAPPRALHGRADLDLIITGPPSDPKVELTGLGTDLGYDAPGRTVLLNYDLHTLSVSAQGSKDGVQIEQVRLEAEGGLALASGQIVPVVAPSGSFEWRLQDGVVTSEGLSLATLLRSTDAAPNPWVDMLMDIEATLSGPLKPLRLEGPYEIAVAEFAVGDRPIDAPDVVHTLAIPYANTSGTLVLYPDHIDLKGESLHTPRNHGDYTGRVDFPDGGALDLSLNLRRADLRDFAPLGSAKLRGRGVLKGRLRGPFKTMAFDGWGDLRGFSATGIDYADRITTPIRSPRLRTLELSGVDAIKGSTRYGGNFRMSFESPLSIEAEVLVPDGRIEDLTGTVLDLPGLTGGAEGTLQLLGPMQTLEGEAHLTLQAVDLFGERFDTGEVHGVVHDGTFMLDDLVLERGEGSEGMRLSGSVGKHYALEMALTADLALSNSTWRERSGVPIDGDLSALIHIGGTLAEPAPDGRMVLRRTRFSGEPARDSVVRFRTKEGELGFEAELIGDTAHLVGSYGLWTDSAYTVDAALRGFEAHMAWPVAVDGQDVTALVGGTARLTGRTGASAEGPRLVVDLPEVLLAWDRHTLTNPTPWHFDLERDAWAVEGVSIEGPTTMLRLAASGDQERTFVQGTGHLDADLGRAIVPGLQRVDGEVRVDLSARGHDGELNARADVQMDAPIVRHSGFPETLEDVLLRAELSSDGFAIRQFSAHVGGGNFQGSAHEDAALAERFTFGRSETPLGFIEAEGWMPTRYDLRARATNVQVKWNDSLPPSVGDAELVFDGPSDAMLLSGQVDIHEMTFSDRINWEEWIVAIGRDLLTEARPTEEPGLFALDIGIRADKSIQLVNNVADAVASADLNVVGDTSQPGMLGWVRIDNGMVYLQDREFLIERGDVAFNDRWSWDPDIDFDLRTDIDTRLQRYRVNYRVLGTVSSWTTTTRSDPPLPQADVNTLLWFGITIDELEDRGETGSALTSAAIDLMIQNLLLSDVFGLRSSGAQAVVSSLDLNTGGVNLRGEYSSDVRLLVRTRVPNVGDLQVEFNMLHDDHYARLDRRLNENWALSAWYATRQREGMALPFGGALGFDVRTNWDFD